MLRLLVIALFVGPPLGSGVGGCPIARDGHGRIARSHRSIAAFKVAHPCPANGKPRGPCPDYVIDHVYPLACGGCDEPSNMQWQTTAEAKDKDRWELKRCGEAL